MRSYQMVSGGARVDPSSVLLQLLDVMQTSARLGSDEDAEPKSGVCEA